MSTRTRDKCPLEFTPKMSTKTHPNNVHQNSGNMSTRIHPQRVHEKTPKQCPLERGKCVHQNSPQMSTKNHPLMSTRFLHPFFVCLFVTEEILVTRVSDFLYLLQYHGRLQHLRKLGRAPNTTDLNSQAGVIISPAQNIGLPIFDLGTYTVLTMKQQIPLLLAKSALSCWMYPAAQITLSPTPSLQFFLFCDGFSGPSPTFESGLG